MSTMPVLVENIGLYWHFVDLVWIFLFPAAVHHLIASALTVEDRLTDEYELERPSHV